LKEDVGLFFDGGLMEGFFDGGLLIGWLRTACETAAAAELC
jgi:hypothetical protein